MTDEHLYTYGVIEQTEFELDLDGGGVADADQLYTVDHRTLSAVVSDIEVLEPEETDENLRAHDKALQAVMEDERTSAVVPMRFGMVFKSARPLKNILRGSRGVLTRALNEIEGTVEMGLKLITEEDATVDRDAVREAVSERLGEVSLEETENGLFSDRLVLNRSYLVERDAREAFDEAIAAIEEEYTGALMVQYTGPWAPYNFVDIEIGVQQ
jgi:hypothetical protein